LNNQLLFGCFRGTIIFIGFTCLIFKKHIINSLILKSILLLRTLQAKHVYLRFAGDFK